MKDFEITRKFVDNWENIVSKLVDSNTGQIKLMHDVEKMHEWIGGHKPISPTADQCRQELFDVCDNVSELKDLFPVWTAILDKLPVFDESNKLPSTLPEAYQTKFANYWDWDAHLQIGYCGDFEQYKEDYGFDVAEEAATLYNNYFWVLYEIERIVDNVLNEWQHLSLINNFSSKIDQQPTAAPEPTEAEPELPESLNTDDFKVILQRAIDNGFVELTDDGYEWIYKCKQRDNRKTLLAYFAQLCSTCLGLDEADNEGFVKTSWLPFEILFRLKKRSLQSAYQNKKQQGKDLSGAIGADKVKSIVY